MFGLSSISETWPIVLSPNLSQSVKSERLRDLILEYEQVMHTLVKISAPTSAATMAPPQNSTIPAMAITIATTTIITINTKI